MLTTSFLGNNKYACYVPKPLIFIFGSLGSVELPVTQIALKILEEIINVASRHPRLLRL